MHTQLIGRGNSVQTILMALVSLLVLGAIHFTPSDAQAGRMKDVHLMHLEAIAEYLYGNADTDGLETRNSSFVPAEAGYQFAVRSEVLVYSPVTDGFDWVPCVTQLVQTGPRSFRVAKTVCQ
jgi:hypothetical protein